MHNTDQSKSLVTARLFPGNWKAAESFKDILLFIHSASSSSFSENQTICCNEYKASCSQFYLLIPPLNGGCHFQFRKTSLYFPIPPLEFSHEDLKALHAFEGRTAICTGNPVVALAPFYRLDKWRFQRVSEVCTHLFAS